MNYRIVGQGVIGLKWREKHSPDWYSTSAYSSEFMKSTIEVLSDRDLMQQINLTKKDRSKVRDFEAVALELGI